LWIDDDDYEDDEEIEDWPDAYRCGSCGYVWIDLFEVCQCPICGKVKREVVRYDA